MLDPPSVEQRVCLNRLASGHNVVVRAQAGAGKTTVFLHSAAAWLSSHPDAHVLIVCYNVNLRTATEKRLNRLGLQERVHASTIHSLAGKLFGTCIGDTMTLQKYMRGTYACTLPAPYSLVLVDEAQDLTPLMLSVINTLAKMTPVQFMVVGDARQEIYGFTHESRLELLMHPQTCLRDNGLPWSECRLLESYRITPPTALFLNEMLRHPDEDGIIGVNMSSQAVRPRYIIGDAHTGDGIDHVIHEMLQLYRPDQIAILAPSVKNTAYGCARIAAMLSERVIGIAIHTSHKQRADVSEEMLQGKLVISTYHNFKGDERDCVIVLGVDERQQRRDGYPRRGGVPVVRTALHVACTRARERLILFHQYDVPAYPSIDLQRLGQFADITKTRPFRPTPLAPLRFGMIIRDMEWITEFASEETLDQLVSLLTVEGPEHLGPPINARPANTVCMGPGLLEDVSCYFPMAILSAVERHRAHQASRMERTVHTVHIPTVSHMERQVAGAVRNPTDLPPLYRDAHAKAVKHEAPNGPRGWLVLSALYNNTVTHKFRHELRQLRHFDWVGPAEIEYFQRCVQTLISATERHEHGDFFGPFKRECAAMKTRLKGTLTYCSVTGDDRYMPWQISFDTEPTEHDLLSVAVSMWLCHTRFGRIFCVPRNTVYRVSVESDQALCAFVSHILAVKRSLEIHAADSDDDDADTSIPFSELI